MALFSIADSSLLSCEAQFKLDRALNAAEKIIRGFDELGWLSLTKEVFGTALPDLPSSIHVALLDNSALQGKAGAYLGSNGVLREQIFINLDLIEHVDTNYLIAVLLEEYGHHLDHLINPGVDTAGDEGAIFSLRARGLGVPELEKTENDHFSLLLGSSYFNAESSNGALTFFRTTPDGQEIPASASSVGGILLQLTGLNGASIYTQAAASGLYKGFFDSSTGAVGTQSGIDFSVLGGGLSRVSMRWTIEDGDTESGNFDHQNVQLGVNNIPIDSASDLTAYSHDENAGSTSLRSGFPDGATATGWVTTTDSIKLEQIYDNIISNSGVVEFHLFDNSPNDNYFDFSRGINSTMSQSNVIPNIAPTLSGFSLFTGAFRGEYYQLSFNDLLSASDASDADQDPISFRIESIQNGVLEKQVSGVWQPVISGQTLLSPGELLRWKSDAFASGNVDAFSVKAWDGDLASSVDVSVVVDTVALEEIDSFDALLPKEVLYSPSFVVDSGSRFDLLGADASVFSIDPLTGKVFLPDGGRLSKKSLYELVIRSTDASGSSSERLLNVSVFNSDLSFWKEGVYKVDSALTPGGKPTSSSITLKTRNGNYLSDASSRFWNGLGAIKSNNGFRLLQKGERGRHKGQYRIAEFDNDGVMQNTGPWLREYQAVASGYQELFTLDLNGDGHKGLPVTADSDSDGFADALGHYRLIGASRNVDFKGRGGTVLSSESSTRWDALMAKETASGFDVLIQGRRGRTADKYQVWKTDQNGTVISNGQWMDRSTLVNGGYESVFYKDLDGDTHIGTPPAIISATDNNNDGFVDGLGHYKLKGASPADAVDFKGRRGSILSAGSSRSWDALMAKAKGDGTGFDVLIQGTRGRNKGNYRVWQTDTTGTVTSNGRWMNLDTLVDEGYETIFNKDFNSDGDFGSPAQLGALDTNSDGFVDGITNYTLFKSGVSPSPAQAIDLIDRRGRNLSDRSSRQWNAIKAVETLDGDFKVLIQGERGRRRTQYQVWTADDTGLIIDQSHWQSGNQLAADGYESLFSFDANNNGTIGS